MLRTVKFIVLECYRYIAEDGKSFVGERCALPVAARTQGDDG